MKNPNGLVKGKRYEWNISNCENKKKDELFTGEYAKVNGCVRG